MKRGRETEVQKQEKGLRARLQRDRVRQEAEARADEQRLEAMKARVRKDIEDRKQAKVREADELSKLTPEQRVERALAQRITPSRGDYFPPGWMIAFQSIRAEEIQAEALKASLENAQTTATGA